MIVPFQAQQCLTAIACSLKRLRYKNIPLEYRSLMPSRQNVSNQQNSADNPLTEPQHFDLTVNLSSYNLWWHAYSWTSILSATCMARLHAAWREITNYSVRAKRSEESTKGRYIISSRAKSLLIETIRIGDQFRMAPYALYLIVCLCIRLSAAQLAITVVTPSSSRSSANSYIGTSNQVAASLLASSTPVVLWGTVQSNSIRQICNQIVNSGARSIPTTISGDNWGGATTYSLTLNVSHQLYFFVAAVTPLILSHLISSHLAFDCLRLPTFHLFIRDRHRAQQDAFHCISHIKS